MTLIQPSRKRKPRARRVLGEFPSVESLLAGIDALKSGGYDTLETFTPFDIPELDARLGLRRSRIGWLVFTCGLIGMVLAFGIQWWANVHNYPLNSGGRPVFAIPSFIFPTFEGLVLAASFGAFFGVLAWLHLPRLWAPIDEVEGFTSASIDRFWIAVGAVDADDSGERAQKILRDSGAIQTFAPADV